MEMKNRLVFYNKAKKHTPSSIRSQFDAASIVFVPGGKDESDNNVYPQIWTHGVNFGFNPEEDETVQDIATKVDNIEANTLTADEEFISINNTKITPKDVEYNESNFTGYGKVWLKKNEVTRDLSNPLHFDGSVTSYDTEVTVSGITITKTVVDWDEDITGDVENSCSLASYGNQSEIKFDTNTKKFLFKSNNNSRVFYDCWGLSDTGSDKTSAIYNGVAKNNPNLIFTDGDDIYLYRKDDAGELNLEKIRETYNKFPTNLVNKENTIYYIQYDYELEGTLNLPIGAVLCFIGGSIRGGVINGDATNVIIDITERPQTNINETHALHNVTLNGDIDLGYGNHIFAIEDLVNSTPWIKAGGNSSASTQYATDGSTLSTKVGQSYFNTQLNKVLYFAGNNVWVDSEGHTAGITRGTTAERNALLNSLNAERDFGYKFFDTEMGRNFYVSKKSATTEKYLEEVEIDAENPINAFLIPKEDIDTQLQTNGKFIIKVNISAHDWPLNILCITDNDGQYVSTGETMTIADLQDEVVIDTRFISELTHDSMNYDYLVVSTAIQSEPDETDVLLYDIMTDRIGWVDEDGRTAGPISGAVEDMPTNLTVFDKGYEYYATNVSDGTSTVSKPYYWDGTQWVDSNAVILYEED